MSYLYGFAANGASALGSGVYAQVTHAFGEQLTGGSNSGVQTNQYQGARVGYAAGPLNVAVATANVQTAASGLKDKEFNVGASYDLGVANVMVKTGTNTVAGATDVKYTWNSIGAKIPMGAGYIPVSYNTGKNNANSQQGSQFAIGYVHNLSKRTALYGTYSSINNKNGGTYTFNGGNGGFGAGLAATGNGTGLDLGVRHSF